VARGQILFGRGSGKKNVKTDNLSGSRPGRAHFRDITAQARINKNYLLSVVVVEKKKKSFYVYNYLAHSAATISQGT